MSQAERIVTSAAIQLMSVRPRTPATDDAEKLVRQAVDGLVDERTSSAAD